MAVISCATCGVERRVDALPEACPICMDERQYMPADGVQRWVDPAALDVRTEMHAIEPGLWSVVLHGAPGIGQHAKIVQTDAGCVMVEAPAAITDEAVAAVRALGDVKAIIPTHPHMYGCQSLWAAALGATVYVAKADAGWLGERPARLEEWDGELAVGGVRASSPGGHFPGSAVVHWTARDGCGVVVAGDTVMANPDRRTVSFMRSYPNRIPLSARVVARIARHMERYEYERLYNNFGDRVPRDAQGAVQYSAQRHIAWVMGTHDGDT